jgi:hypothetical protein
MILSFTCQLDLRRAQHRLVTAPALPQRGDERGAAERESAAVVATQILSAARL